MVSFEVLLEMAGERHKELQAAGADLDKRAAALDAEIAAKRAERAIAAQEEVQKLLKRRDAERKENEVTNRSCALVGRAVARLRLASSLGVEDWASLIDRRLKVSPFVSQQLLAEPRLLEKLSAACGAEITTDNKDSSLSFVGVAPALEKLKQRLAAMGSSFSLTVSCTDDPTRRLLEERGEIASAASRNGVEIVPEEHGYRVVGPQSEAEKAAVILTFLCAGREDLECPRRLVGQCKARANKAEGETGAFIEVLRGDGPWSMVHIRGSDESVEEATQELRAWLDEQENAISEFVDGGAFFDDDQFWKDCSIMGQNFGVRVKESKGRRIEIRGPSVAVGDAVRELNFILEFYAREEADAVAGAAGASAEAVPEDDEWASAPTAEPAPCTW